MYVCLFTDSHVYMPFDEFIMSVFRTVNMALTQLHPNSWVSFQAFRLLVEMLRLNPLPYIYLHYYSSRPSDPIR